MGIKVQSEKMNWVLWMPGDGGITRMWMYLVVLSHTCKKVVKMGWM
jgi:hypothetical protein